jgi:hypothetical protein
LVQIADASDADARLVQCAATVPPEAVVLWAPHVQD